MNKIKEVYSQPTAELLIVRFEEGLLYVSGGRNYSSMPGGAGGDDVYDDEEDTY
jgi:hypothetical protein